MTGSFNPQPLPGDKCTGRNTTMEFTNSAFTNKFFIYYFGKMSNFVELMAASFDKEATTANGKQFRDQLRFRHRQLSLSVTAILKEVRDLPRAAILTPAQQRNFGTILVDSIKHFSWIITLVCEGCCPVDRRVHPESPPSMSLFIKNFPLMTENIKHHLKQLSQFRHSHVHAANTYADHQGELCHSRLTSYKQCGSCRVYVTLLKGCQLRHDRLTWGSLTLTKFLGTKVDSPTALEMSDVLDQEFYQHSALEHFLWSSPFTYQMLFEGDSCLQSGSTLVSAIFRSKFPERRVKDSNKTLPYRENTAVMKDRAIYDK